MKVLCKYNWLIVGLGNPGKRYKKTFHNTGFMFINYLVNKYNGKRIWIDKNSEVLKGRIHDKNVLFLKPRTYMNFSGISVKEVAEKFNIDSKHIILCFDDYHIKIGEVKTKKNIIQFDEIRGKYFYDHNGVENCHDILNTDYLIKIKFGTKTNDCYNKSFKPKNYVLENRDKKTICKLKSAFESGEISLFRELDYGKRRNLNH